MEGCRGGWRGAKASVPQVCEHACSDAGASSGAVEARAPGSLVQSDVRRRRAQAGLAGWGGGEGVRPVHDHRTVAYPIVSVQQLGGSTQCRQLISRRHRLQLVAPWALPVAIGRVLRLDDATRVEGRVAVVAVAQQQRLTLRCREAALAAGALVAADLQALLRALGFREAGRVALPCEHAPLHRARGCG